MAKPVVRRKMLVFVCRHKQCVCVRVLLPSCSSARLEEASCCAIVRRLAKASARSYTLWSKLNPLAKQQVRSFGSARPSGLFVFVFVLLLLLLLLLLLFAALVVASQTKSWLETCHRCRRVSLLLTLRQAPSLIQTRNKRALPCRRLGHTRALGNADAR